MRFCHLTCTPATTAPSFSVCFFMPEVPQPPHPWGEGNRAPLLRLNKNRFAGHITPGSGKDLHYPFSQATS